jgi:hypothetical protein
MCFTAQVHQILVPRSASRDSGREGSNVIGESNTEGTVLN